MTRPTRVLHVATNLGSGGVERWLADLNRRLSQQGVEFHIAHLLPELGLFGKRLADEGARLVHVAGHGKPMEHARAIRSVLRERGPFDAVHAHLGLFSAFALCAARSRGVPVRIAHSHNVVNQARGGLRGRSYLWTTRTLLRTCATACVAPSREALDDMIGGVPSLDRIGTVLPCGFPFDAFRKAQADAGMRAELGLGHDDFVFGSVGRLAPEKNFRLLVDILGAGAEDRRAQLVIFGEGPERDALIRRAEQLGVDDRLRLPGAVGNIPTALRSVLDVFVSTSPPPPEGNESLGIAVLEAQVAGVPCVVSNGIYDAGIIAPSIVSRCRTSASPEEWWREIRERARAVGSTHAAQIAAAAEAGYDIDANAAQFRRLYTGGASPQPAAAAS
jgi:glycosyltransferase EpsF